MHQQKKILLAGATGYLGGFIAHELTSQGYDSRLIVRDKKKSFQFLAEHEVIQAEVTKPDSLHGLFSDVDTVISTIGITRQKDGLTYMDVDYQANVNLLEQARKEGVRKFIYVSSLNGEKLRHLKICEAKERFADHLKTSGLEYTIIRPNGFFSDLGELLDMARKGRVFFFGDGQFRLNPIHGQDLAEVCVKAIHQVNKEIEIGGPDYFTLNEIAQLAAASLKRDVKVNLLPHWLRKVILLLLRTFTSSKTYGPLEFFLTTMAMDMMAPRYGKIRLQDHFKKLSSQGNRSAA